MGRRRATLTGPTMCPLAGGVRRTVGISWGGWRGVSTVVLGAAASRGRLPRRQRTAVQCPLVEPRRNMAYEW